MDMGKAVTIQLGPQVINGNEEHVRLFRKLTGLAGRKYQEHNACV
jgi:hypothetical protein